MFWKHSAIYLVARGIPSIVAFLSIAVFTRLLTPEEFGVYTLIYTGAIFTNAVLYQWLRIGVLRFYQEREEASGEVIATVAVAFGFISLILAFSAVAVSVFGSNQIMMVALIGLVLVVAQAAFDIVLELARVRLAPIRYGLLAFTRSTLMLGGGILGFYIYSVHGLLIGISIGIIIAVAIETPSAMKGVKLSRANKLVALDLLRFGAPLTATFALAGLLGFSDRYMLAWLSGVDSAGQYSAVYDFSQKTLITAMMIINLAGYPLILRTMNASGEDLNRRLIDNLNGLLLVGLPLVAYFMLISQNISAVFFGSEFRQVAAELLPWIALATLFEGLKIYYYDLSFQLSKKTYHQVWIVAFAAATNVILNLIFIPKHGIMGAAWATLLSNVCAFVLSFVIGKQQIRFPVISLDGAKIILATGFMAGALISIKRSSDFPPWIELALMTLLAGSVYGVVLVVINFMGIRSRLTGMISSVVKV